MNERKPYETDLADAEWQLLEPLMPPKAREGRPREREPRELINAILYKLKTDCHWRLLPHDFPPCKTVYHYYAKWRDDGTLKRIHDQLRGRTRVDAGRNREPSVGIIESQTVKTSEKGGLVATTVARRQAVVKATSSSIR